MTIVRTQQELDAALAAGEGWIEIRSEAGVWLTVAATGSATVTAYGSATVRAYGSATVTATDSATVRASGSATVRAYGSATVRAYDSATVRATPHVAVHLHSASVDISGGVVIDVSKPILDPADWCAYHGVTVSKAGVATLYKAVGDDYLSTWGGDYTPGTKPSDPDWYDDNKCGHGLHFSPTPGQALAYMRNATRFVEVGVKVTELCPIPGGTAKCKAPRVVRACREVDIDGTRIGGAR